MDLLKLATDLFMRNVGQSAGGKLSASAVTSALQSLLAGPGGKLDIGDLVSKFSSGGLQSTVSSWLGDGDNQDMSVQQVVGALGKGPIAEFAGKLGLSSDDASKGLAATLPEVIDKASSGGNPLNADALGKALGGIGGMFGR